MGKSRGKRKPTKPVTASVPKPLDSEGTPERLLHAANDIAAVEGTIERAGEKTPKVRRFKDSPIERMHRAGRVTQAQLDAANWYAAVWEVAAIAGRTVANYDSMPSGGAADVGTKILGSERQYEARKLWRKARATMADNLVRLVDDVVLHHIVPDFGNGQQRDRYGQTISKALQPLAEWLLRA